MSFLETVQSHARLIILRTLVEDTSYSGNDSALTDVARLYGVDRGRDFIRAECRWLEGVGAVTVREVGGTLIVTATERGVDHVARRIIIDGVKRPSPGA